MPPAMSTFWLVVPFEEEPRRVALADHRPPLIELVALQVPVVLSKSSAEASPVVLVGLLRPPAARTLPVSGR